ncbi:MAG: ornithine cyclodeaminase family protein [Ahrensia sp.]
MRIVSAADVDATLTFPALIDALAGAFCGNIQAPPRHHHTKPNDSASDQTLLLMPAWDERYITTKLVCVTPDNGARALPAVMASVIVMNAETGAQIAMIDGARVTLWRTACASALAARYLARQDAENLLIVGAGALAPFLVKAHCAVRNYKRISIWNRNSANAEAVAKLLADEGINADVSDDLSAATAAADTISSATLSTVPLIKGADLRPGTHLDLVGAFTPLMRETDDACVQRASLFVDTFAGALSEGGDLVQPIKSGLISRDDVRAELSMLTKGDHGGRRAEDEITLFKSTGASLEDFAAAALICDRLGLA